MYTHQSPANSFRRVTLLVIGLLLGGSSLAQQTLTFAGWSGEEAAAIPAIESMMTTFEADHPDVNVEWIGWPFDDILQNYQLRLRSNQAPEVAQLSNRWLSVFAVQDALVDFGEVFGKDYLASKIDPGFLALGDFNGQQLGLPWIVGSIGMVANLQVLEQAGVESLPKTVDEFVASLRAIKQTNPQAVPFAITTKEASGIVPDFQIWLWTHGGQVFDEGGNVTIDSPEAAAALQFLVDLENEGLIAMDMARSDARVLFGASNTGYYFDATEARGTAQVNSGQGEDFDQYVQPMATPVLAEGDRSYAVSWAHLLIMFKQANQELTAEKPAAQFVSHLVLEPEMPLAYFEERSALPSNTEAVNSPAVKEDAYAATWLELARTITKNDEFSQFANGAEMTDVVAEEVQSALLDQKSAEQAVADMARRLEVLLARVQ